MKEAYQKPEMVTEVVDVAKLVGSPSYVMTSPIQQMDPLGGLCCH